MLEDIKRGDSNQCFFIGLSFIIVGMKWLGCVHDTDRSILQRKTEWTELDRNIVSLLCSWNKVAHFKENKVCKFVASFYFIPTAFFVILLCVCVCMCMSVCVCVCLCVCLCVCPQAFISFHSKGLSLSKMTSKTCARQTNISWLTSVNSTFLHLNIQNS